uniref:Uncharacterized protein n=1 Tax=Branchiostoma floridae TaxID=7739 RepID=C3Y9P6_BRAFL|eukprot:XP_002607292.1 hypothetical protein BRAFLDRAFT_88241 [Branchiostoma floridae]
MQHAYAVQIKMLQDFDVELLIGILSYDQKADIYNYVHKYNQSEKNIRGNERGAKKEDNDNRCTVAGCDSCIVLDGNVKNHRQSRLHLALVQYFDLRGAYNQAGLARMEAVGQETGKRILVLQDGINDAVREITGFLKGQLDGSAAREVSEVAAKALREETHTPLPDVVREDTRTSASRLNSSSIL